MQSLSSYQWLFFGELEQIISQFVWKYKKNSNSQSHLEKEEWIWMNQPAWLQATLQSYSHQDSIALAQRQKYRSMEQNRKPRDKSTHLWTPWASLVAQRLKRLPGMQETRVRSLGREDPLEKEMATHSSTLAWRIPWSEEPDRLQSMGSQRVRHDRATSLWTPYLWQRRQEYTMEKRKSL